MDEKWILDVDTTNLCRACLKTVNKNFFWMESFYLDEKFAEIYENVTSIQIVRGEDRPKKICTDCYNLVIKFKHFKSRVLMCENVLIKRSEMNHDNPIRCEDLDVERESSRDHNIDDVAQLDEDLDKTKLSSEKEINKTNDKPFKCPGCDRSFSCRGNFNRHCKTHSYERPFKCTICDKGFLRNSSREVHELTAHTDKKDVLCTVCGKAFKHRSFLNKHIQSVHDKTTKLKRGSGYPCQICGNIYRTKSSLAVHKKKHEKPKPFLCTMCGKTYSSKDVLQNHQKLHTGEKSFTCDICYKSFRFVGTLKNHILIHSGEKPLKCPICGKQFRQHAHLTTHMKSLHTPTRPYECNYCGKTFKQNSNLVVHTRTHTGETPYHCDYCSKGFYDSSNMKKHRKKHEDKLTPYNEAATSNE